jgi:hypothetical protein
MKELVYLKEKSILHFLSLVVRQHKIKTLRLTFRTNFKSLKKNYNLYDLRFNLKINKFCKILLTNFSKLSSKRLLKQFKANWTVVYNKTYTILLKNEVLYQDGYRNKFQAGTRVWISEGIMLYRIICMIPVRMKIIISNKINWNQISSLNKISCLQFNFLKLILSNLKQLFRN